MSPQSDNVRRSKVGSGGGLTSPAQSSALEALDRKEEELKQALRTEEEKEQAVLARRLGGRRDREGSGASR